MRRSVTILLTAACLLLVLVAATSLVRHHRTQAHADPQLLRPFQSNAVPSAAAYDGLAIYFMQGFESYKTAHGTGAAYPGMASFHGPQVDAMEGFSRMAPLWASWVASGRPGQVNLRAGELTDLTQTFRSGLLAGTDPRSPEYWGDMHDSDQRIVEASDIALSLWLLRHQVWEKLSASEQRQVVAWLGQVNGKVIPDNNWHLFVVLVDAVLKQLASTDNQAEAQKHYARLKSFYRGEGWFSDGPDNVFDYYNAWGIHYQLFWLQQVDPEWDTNFISDARQQFLRSYRYLMTPSGFPIMGRSVCYRMAAPVPLVLDQFDLKHGDAGEARRALDVTWQYFIQHSGVSDGNMTQGYCGSDPRVLDNYSGPASCLWGLRSLIAALYLPRDSEFWRQGESPLPVEKGDFAVEIRSTGWKIVGDNRNKDVKIFEPRGSSNASLQPYTVAERVNGMLHETPDRPDNHTAKYDRPSYSSAAPFCGCK